MPLTGFNHTARPKYVVVFTAFGPNVQTACRVFGSFITEKTAIAWADTQDAYALLQVPRAEGVSLGMSVCPLTGPGETARGGWHTTEAHRTAAIEAQKGAA